MPSDGSLGTNPLGQLFLHDAWILFQLGLIVFFGLYFIFSLIIVRQVQLMTDTLITSVSPLLRALSILLAVISLGVIVVMITILF